MAKATRVLVANRPKLMRDVVLAALAGQPGIEIVGEVADEAEILTQVRDTRPDLLVIALDEADLRPAICDRALLTVASRKDRTLYLWASFDSMCRYRDICGGDPGRSA